LHAEPQEKPLKRFSNFPLNFNTGLKPGVNETRLLRQSKIDPCCPTDIFPAASKGLTRANRTGSSLSMQSRFVFDILIHCVDRSCKNVSRKNNAATCIAAFRFSIVCDGGSIANCESYGRPKIVPRMSPIPMPLLFRYPPLAY
jgi:hypothetical protein